MVYHSDPVLSCSVSLFLALISVLKMLKIGFYLSVIFSSFNPEDDRLTLSRRQINVPKKT